MEPLRFVIFDETDTGSRASGGPRRATDGTLRGSHGLTWIWRLGAVMHRRTRYAVATRGASSWSDALRWIVAEAHRARRPITEVQVWGHGGWGFMMLGRDRLDVDTIAEGGVFGASINALRDALAPDALFWLRCCSAFGTEAGHRLASTLTDRLRVRVAGHTHIIGAWQSGTRSLSPGEAPSWSVSEGVEHDAAGRPRAMLSSLAQTRTLGCLSLGLPAGW